MAFSLSARLGLKRPLALHGYSRTEYYDNLSILDNYPGVFPCSSDTRPTTWGTAQTGQFILESDTTLLWRWDGAAFLRAHPVGLLANPVEINTDYPTAATTPQVAISCPVVIPATNAGSVTKRIRIEGSCYAIENGTDLTLGVAELSVTRDGAVIDVKRVRGRPSVDIGNPMDWGVGQTIIAYDDPPMGDCTYAVCINSIPAIGGTTTLKASATHIARLAVSEVGL